MNENDKVRNPLQSASRSQVLEKMEEKKKLRLLGDFVAGPEGAEEWPMSHGFEFCHSNCFSIFEEFTEKNSISLKIGNKEVSKMSLKISC